MTARKVKLSDQMRRIIADCGMSQYRLCQTVGLSQASMSRFMAGDGGLSMRMLDRIGDVLGLEVIVRQPHSRTNRR